MFTAVFLVGSCTFFHQVLEQTVLFKDSISKILADISHIATKTSGRKNGNSHDGTHNKEPCHDVNEL